MLGRESIILKGIHLGQNLCHIQARGFQQGAVDHSCTAMASEEAGVPMRSDIVPSGITTLPVDSLPSEPPGKPFPSLYSYIIQLSEKTCAAEILSPLV